MASPFTAEMNRLLEQVSRSFYLTLRVLPAPIRPQIGLAYLLARATDTIADTHLVPVERRQAALRGMRAAIVTTAAGRTVLLPDFGELAVAQAAPAGQGSHGERLLLERAGGLLEALRGFSREDRQLVCEVLHTITFGQEEDLARFGRATADRIVALETDEDLDQYTYCVAGCVGEFWTRMCLAHVFQRTRMDDSTLLSNGVRFGKGLQLVNILRDLPRDLRLGRCYMPRASLAELGLAPQDLLDPSSFSRFRPLFDAYLRRAREHLSAGWIYTAALPHGQVRIRLACAWPILIGVKTLARLGAHNVLDDANRIKISRSEIRRVILSSVMRCPFSGAWNRLFDKSGSP
jgi:farnesyl-diphosphate farnesyltransferase